jgi:hypothetical protein
VNILVSFFHHHPEAVDALIDGNEAISFERVATVLAAGGFQYLITEEQIAEALPSDEALRPTLREGYLPAIHLDQWRDGLERAEPVREVPESDWVVYAAGREQPVGITLPEDREQQLRVSLFCRIDDRVGRVSIDYADGPPTPTGLSTAIAECSLPDWGRCEQDGACQGECGLGRAFGPERVVCRCAPQW